MAATKADDGPWAHRQNVCLVTGGPHPRTLHPTEGLTVCSGLAKAKGVAAAAFRQTLAPITRRQGHCSGLPMRVRGQGRQLGHLRTGAVCKGIWV